MKEIFESKYGIKMEESKLGKLIMNSYSFIRDDQIDYDKTLYDISFNDKDTVTIDFTKIDINGIAKIIIKSDENNIDYINNKELRKEIASDIGVDDVDITSFTRIGPNKIAITINSAKCIVNIDKLEDFNCDKKYKDIQSKVQSYNENQSKNDKQNER